MLDGAGDVALYGQEYQATDPGLNVTRVPDTTPPVVTAVSLNPKSISQSQVGSVLNIGTAQAHVGVAPITQASVHVYDSSGTDVGQVGEGVTQAGDGSFTFGVYVNRGTPPGGYTIRFGVSDSDFLTTFYGTPGGNPMPGGPLQLTTTS